jgi:hypothetical protein
MGVAWASGINLYAAVAMLGLGGTLGYVDLPPTRRLSRASSSSASRTSAAVLW